MLEFNHEAQLEVRGLMQALPSQVELPAAWTDFFLAQGPLPREFTDLRRYTRFYYRAKGALRRKDELWQVLTKDVSRDGVGLLAPQQLFPKEQVRLWTADELAIDLCVARCTRIQDRCYECGTVVTGDESRKAVELLLRSLIRQANS